MTLVLGNPFRDNVAGVGESFIKENDLLLDDTVIAEEDIRSSTWEKLSNEIQKVENCLGGSGANVAKAFARLGNDCTLHGMVGNDGEDIHEQLTANGVQPELAQTEDIQTGIANIFVSSGEEGPNRSMQANFGSSIAMSEDNISAQIFENITHVHIEGYQAYFGTIAKAISLAKENGATVSIDLASAKLVNDLMQYFKENLPKVDYIFGNREEILAYIEKETPKEAVEAFDRNQTAVLTDGPNECWVKAKGEKHARSYPVARVDNIIDPTGAGDFFQAGFLDGALKKEQAQKCVLKGNLAASFVIQQLGTDLSEEKWAEMREKLESIQQFSPAQ